MSFTPSRRFTRITLFLAPLSFVMALSGPALADPTVGLGLSFSFGGGKVDTGIGLRVFSDNRQDKFVGSVGLDYMFQSKRVRPTVGAAYLGKNTYLGLDMGFDFNGGGVDFGIGAGGVNTKRPVAPAPDIPDS